MNNDEYDVLSDLGQPSDGQENPRINKTLQLQMVQKELITIKKLLRETQAKLNIMSSDNAKLQNANHILEQSLKKSELKFKEVIEKLSLEQIKNKELTYLNKQLLAESEQTNVNKNENIGRLLENFNKLKDQVSETQTLWDKQKQNVLDLLFQANSLVQINQKSFFGDQFPNASSSICEVIEKSLEKAINILEQGSFRGQQNQEILNNLQLLKTRIFELEEQNNLLKKQKNDIQQEFNNTNTQYNQLITKYKDQIEKLTLQNRTLTISQEAFQRNDEVKLNRQHEQEKENLFSRIQLLENQQLNYDIQKQSRSKEHKSKSKNSSEEKKNKSDKKIKKQIMRLDEEILQLQKSLSQEMGKMKIK